MLGARRLLLSYKTRERLVCFLRRTCGWIRTSSSLSPLQVQLDCYASKFTLPAPQRCLSLASNKPKKLESANKRIFEDFAEDATEAVPKQGKYVRKDNLKWQKSPWKVKQLRFTRHIRNLVRKGKVGEAHEVFEQMKKGKVRPDVAVFNTLIAGYGREGNVQTCFKLFNEMKKRSLLPTDHTYSSMFAACAEAGPKSSKILDKLQDEVERRNVLLNSISSNALITALAACGRHDDAGGIYTDMLNKHMTPDPHTFSSLLLAAAHNKEDGFEAGQRAWSEMIASGVQPDLHCFNVLLQCVRDGGISPAVLERVSEENRLVALKLNLDFADDDSIMSRDDSVNVELCVSGVATFALGQGNRLRVYLGHVEGKRRGPTIRWLETEDIKMLFALLKELKLQPEIRTFHLLAHLTFEPSFLMREMAKLKRRVVPDGRFMVAAIKMQALLGNLSGAKLLLDYSSKADLDLDQAGYQAVASSCLEKKDGIKLLDEMKVHNVVPNEYVFGTLIGNAARSRSYEYLTALLKKMLHFEMVPNDTILEILEAAALHKPNNERQAKRLNGFKGFYKIWKGVMVPQDDQEELHNLTTDSSS